jgi:tritrans,polycis-undecaprenyl-diphosphate synthase [geranylgeranyl-diphosphate specific]
MAREDFSELVAGRLKSRLGRAIGRGFRRVARTGAAQKVYEQILWNQIKEGPIPEHIGVILDGNRRWAVRQGLDPWAGHARGARKLEEFLGWCEQIDAIRAVTAYVFSTENFKRSEREVGEIFRLLEEYLQRLLHDERIVRNQIRVKMIGRTHVLPARFQELVRQVEEKTAHYERRFFNIAIAYGGRGEIIDAVRAIARAVLQGELSTDKIDEAVLEGYLYTAHLPRPSPDLIIRTSGEIRLSNFLTWQGAYSELCFMDVYWPDFRRLDLLRAIRVYQRRRRRFGA